MNASVGRPARTAACRSDADAERQLAGGLAAVDRRRPDRLAVAVACRRADRLTVNATRVPSGDRRGSDGTARRYRSSGRAGRGTGSSGLGRRDGGPERRSGWGARIGRGGRASLSRAATAGYHRPRDGREQLSFRLDPALPGPGDVAPMWPIPRPDPFDSPDHLFEPTWGGHRVLAFVGPAELPGAGEVRVVDPTGPRPRRRASRSSRGLAVRVAARSAVLDGELVVVDGAGARTTTRSGRGSTAAAGPAGRAARVRPPPPRRRVAARTPLEKRRAALRRVLRPGDEVVVVPAIAGEGRALHDAVSAQGIAGVLARRRTSPYLPGVRSKLWRSIVAGRAGRGAGRPAPDAAPDGAPDGGGTAPGPRAVPAPAVRRGPRAEG